MKVTLGRCAVFVIAFLALRSQGAEAWQATSVGLVFSYLVFPSRPLP